LPHIIIIYLPPTGRHYCAVLQYTVVMTRRRRFRPSSAWDALHTKLICSLSPENVGTYRHRTICYIGMPGPNYRHRLGRLEGCRRCSIVIYNITALAACSRCIIACALAAVASFNLDWRRRRLRSALLCVCRVSYCIICYTYLRICICVYLYVLYVIYIYIYVSYKTYTYIVLCITFLSHIIYVQMILCPTTRDADCRSLETLDRRLKATRP